jgi:Sulfotransferase domain
MRNRLRRFVGGILSTDSAGSEIGAIKKRLDESEQIHKSSLEALRALAPTLRQVRDAVVLANLGSLPVTTDSVFGAQARGASPHALLLNSVPKAGTYLLLEVMKAFGGFNDCRHHTYTESIRKLNDDGSFDEERVMPALEWLAALAPGLMCVSHLEYGSFVEQYLINRKDLKVVFIVRDPRDIVISWVDFVFESKSYAQMTAWNAFQQQQGRIHQPSDEERITASIEGLLNSDIRQFIPWINSPACLTIKFEDLYQAVNGGNYHVLDRLADYLEISRKRSSELGESLGRGLTSSGRADKIGVFRHRMNEVQLERIRQPDFHRLVLEFGYDPH